MRELAVQLSDQQRLLVHLIVNQGKGTQEAGELAGYKNGSVYSALKRPAVAAAIGEAIQLDLAVVGAPLAYRVAKSLLADDQVSARVRADISFKVMDRAGHIVHTHKRNEQQKGISEMTRDEMLAHIEKNQLEIERIERELSDAARDVSAPHIAPSDRVLGAKPLNYLD